MMKLNFGKIVILLAALLVAGCTSFEKRWTEATRVPSLESDPQGAWVGTWQNTNNTHNGALRAILTRNSETNYTALFHATWGKHSGSFSTKLKGQRDGWTLNFTGSKHILFFKIQNRGYANPTNFWSTYESKFDDGTFTLHRPKKN